jgi:cytochrome c553
MIKLLPTIFALAVSFMSVATQAQDITGNAQAGQKINAMCIGCHGIKGYQASFPEVYKVPMISGQSAKYLSKG